MTTPEERARNTRWAREALGELAMDLDMPAAVREEASQLLERFPERGALERVAGQHWWLIAEELQETFARTRLLLQRVMSLEKTDATRRRSLLVILRHFC